MCEKGLVNGISLFRGPVGNMQAFRLLGILREKEKA